MRMKICTKCRRELPLTEFGVHRGRRHGRAHCKDCGSSSAKQRRETNGDTIRERDRERERSRYALDPSFRERKKEGRRSYFLSPAGNRVVRSSVLKNNYGITLDEYEAMLGEQNGLCRLCFGISEGKNLAVDHDHVAGYDELPPDEKRRLVRGLLCDACNRGIGLLRDDADLLRRAIAYLEGR